MNSEIELKRLKKEIKGLKKEVALLKGENENQIPTYQYSKIRDTELKKLFEIRQKLNDHVFDEWFLNQIEIDNEVEVFLTDLIAENKPLIERYNEEDLKVYYLKMAVEK